jgi:hypothetical protein
MPSGSWIHISVKPQGSVAGPRRMGTAAAASRACSAWTSRTWIQIITERPGRPAVRPETPGQARAEEEHHPGIVRGRTRGRWPGPVRRGRSGGCGPSRWAAPGSGCSERPRDYFSITLSDTAGQQERAQSRRRYGRNQRLGYGTRLAAQIRMFCRVGSLALVLQDRRLGSASQPISVAWELLAEMCCVDVSL